MYIILAIIAIFNGCDGNQDIIGLVYSDNLSYLEYCDLEACAKLDEQKQSFIRDKSPISNNYFLKITKQIPVELETCALRKVIAQTELVVSAADSDEGLNRLEKQSETAKMNPFKMLYSTKEGPFLFYIGRKTRIIYELDENGASTFKKLLELGSIQRTSSEKVFKTTSRLNTKDLFYIWNQEFNYLIISESISLVEDLESRVYSQKLDENTPDDMGFIEKGYCKYGFSYSDMNVRYKLVNKYARDNFPSPELEKQLISNMDNMYWRVKYLDSDSNIIITNKLVFNNKSISNDWFEKMNAQKNDREDITLSDDGLSILKVENYDDDYLKSLMEVEEGENE